MTRKTVAASMTINAAQNPAPVALLAATAALPHLLASGRADSVPRVPTRRPRRLWGREDGFTMAAPR